MRKLIVAAMLCLLVASSAGATTYTLADQANSLSIDPSSGIGAFSWIANGQDQLYQQWWWYRIGPAAAGATHNVSDLVLVSSSQSDPTSLLQVYAPQDNSFTIKLKWSLLGSGDGTWSDVSEQVLVTNNTTSPLDFYLFEYNDFDLNGSATPDYDEASHINSVLVNQVDGAASVTEVVSRVPDYWQVGEWASVYNQVTSGSNLTNTAPYAQGDVAWAFEWHTPLAGNGSVTFSKDKTLSTSIPEWNTLFLAAFGMVGTIGIRMRRR